MTFNKLPYWVRHLPYRDSETLTQRIERTSMRTLTMETSLKDNLHKCHPQNQSSLYNKLPKELRDIVFELATAQYEDLDNAYERNAWFCRPGYRGPLKSSTSLLRTCRRVWLETSSLPMRQATATLWFDRGPSGQLRDEDCLFWTSLNKMNLEVMQLFTQRHMAYQVTGGLTLTLGTIRTLQPKVLRIKWRHTDWFRWEDGLDLKCDDDWIEQLLRSEAIQRVQRLEIELETLTRNRSQLEPIVERISQLEGPPMRVGDGSGRNTQMKVLDAPKVWHWTGPVDINGKIEPAHQNDEKLDYLVIIITWKAVSSTKEYQETLIDKKFPHPETQWSDQKSRLTQRKLPPISNIYKKGRMRRFFNSMEQLRDFFHLYAKRGEEERRNQFYDSFLEKGDKPWLERFEATNSLLKFEEGIKESYSCESHNERLASSSRQGYY